MPSPTVQEKRAEPRYSLQRLARIQLGNGHPPRYCLVTDISDGGVRINTFGGVVPVVPDEFELMLSGDGPAQNGKYKAIWRADEDVGAKLVGQLT